MRALEFESPNPEGSIGVHRGTLRALEDESPNPEGSIGVHQVTLRALDGVKGWGGEGCWRVFWVG